jgi:hypothetical protein
MSVSELLPSIQALPRAEKLKLIELLAADLQRVEPADSLPAGFPPPEDRCPVPADDLAQSRSQPGLYTLDEIWRSVGRT